MMICGAGVCIRAQCTRSAMALQSNSMNRMRLALNRSFWSASRDDPRRGLL